MASFSKEMEIIKKNKIEISKLKIQEEILRAQLMGLVAE